MNDEQRREFLEVCIKSGMRETRCEGCGCYLLTRNERNLCPPCRKEQGNINEEQRQQLSKEIKGKTIESFEWQPPQDGFRGYWVMTFVGGGEMCVVTMTELSQENLSPPNPISA